MRGERQIQAAMRLAQDAANRNPDKPDWRRESIKKLFEKADEERAELKEVVLQSVERAFRKLDERWLRYEFAVLAGDLERIKEELGDVLWCAVMIADHDMALELEEVPNYHLGSE